MVRAKASPTVDNDQGAQAVGMRRREDKPHQRAAEGRDEGCSIASGGVHHRADVVDPCLERRQRLHRHRIGHADAALVEQDESPDRRQASPELREWGHIPLGFLMARPLVRQDEIDRPLAEDLVGDVQAVDAGVVRLGVHL